MPDDGVTRPARARAAWLSTKVLVAVAVTVVALDQVTKALVLALLPLHESVSIVPELLDFTHVRNTGAAFGLLNAVDVPFKPLLMTTIALAALLAVGVLAARTSPGEPLARIGLALVFGGATGNLIDRVTVGYVIDFVDVYWNDWHFWAFNVADSAITVGACLLILDTTILNRHVPTSA